MTNEWFVMLIDTNLDEGIKIVINSRLKRD